MESNSNHPDISRRDFLKIAKETAKAVTAAALASSIRSAFAPQPTPPEITPATTPPEKAVVYEKEIKDRLVESMLKKLIVLDTGKPITGEPLSEYDVWRAITGNYDATEEVFEARQNLTSSLEMTNLERVAANYMYLHEHGKMVMDSIRTGLATTADYQGNAPIEFLPKNTAENVESLFTVEELEEKWYSQSGKNRGPKMVFESPPPEVAIEPGKIVNGSFQFGKHLLSYAEETLTINNTVLTHGDVREFIQKQADYRGNYNATNAPTGEFILPPGKTLQDITSITVVKTQNGEIVDRQEIPITYDQEKQDQPSATHITSDTAPIEHYTLHFNTGESLDINPSPTEEDYDQTWTRIESLTSRPPEEIIGAFDRNNPYRTENLQKLKEFLLQHPDNFWVFSLGNHQDILTEEDMVDMPENCIHVGQSIYNTAGDFYSGTLNGTVGNSETIFVTNTEMGIEGNGSSYAAPQIAAATALYSLENPGKPIKRKDFIKYLQDNGALKQYEWLVPYYEGQTQAEPWQVNMLDVEGYSALINTTARLITEEAKTTSRRDFLRGKFSR